MRRLRIVSFIVVWFLWLQLIWVTFRRVLSHVLTPLGRGKSVNGVRYLATRVPHVVALLRLSDLRELSLGIHLFYALDDLFPIGLFNVRKEIFHTFPFEHRNPFFTATSFDHNVMGPALLITWRKKFIMEFV